MRDRRVLALIAAAVFAVSGCGATVAEGPAAGQPVTVTNCGQEATYPAPPRRVVTNDIGITEMMFALGLADRMAGYVVDSGQNGGIETSSWKADFARVPRLAEKIGKEVVRGANADLVFAGWNYGFSESTGFTPESLRQLGIASYQLTEACRNGKGQQRGIMPPLDALYTDLRNLGHVFGVADRAERLVAEYQRQIDDVRRAIPAGAPRPKVFLFDDGKDQPLTSGRNAGPEEIITRAGGQNIFGDLDDSWTRVNWEAVVARKPDVILINDYGGDLGSVADKEKFLRSYPPLAEVPAVRDGRFFALPYAALVESPRNPAAIQSFAAFLAGR
ncbi:ABC transporter substrate-binding protein [Amycolatopsis anabasis]|uniref:ABC transporter substrate-binding protein n=1 Tax=Amycolatopsis anabasis TaxID=1840409 RepID=UPI00131C60BC|nr:ABC transporter substrate-binding protein [Amycolatopsis anabasis]